MEKLVCRNYAHRGFSGEYPENTMIAFEKALEAGCEGIENDVHLTKDGVLVIIHDEEIDRTGNASGWVKDMTYEELCKVDSSNKFHDKVGFQKIPTSGDVLELDEEKAKVNGHVHTGAVMVDGLGVGDVGNIVLRDRQHLAQDGIIIVVMTIDGDNGHVVAGPDIVTRGFVYVRDSGDLMSEAQSVVADTMDQLSDEGVTDWGRIKNEVKSSLSDYVWKQTQRSPMIIPIIMEI